MANDEPTSGATLPRAELMMHPVRFRVLMTLSGRRMTTRDIAEALPDLSRASVYRHVATLADGGLLQVVETIPNRGTVEKVYAYAPTDAVILPEDTRTPDDYLRYFAVFTQSLLDQFRVYVRKGGADPLRDGVSHWNDAVYLSRAERDELVADFVAAVEARNCNQPTPERVRYVISRVLIPETPFAPKEPTP